MESIFDHCESCQLKTDLKKHILTDCAEQDGEKTTYLIAFICSNCYSNTPAWRVAANILQKHRIKCNSYIRKQLLRAFS